MRSREFGGFCTILLFDAISDSMDGPIYIQICRIRQSVRLWFREGQARTQYGKFQTTRVCRHCRMSAREFRSCFDMKARVVLGIWLGLPKHYCSYFMENRGQQSQTDEN
jgi:hypothetical protein